MEEAKIKGLHIYYDFDTIIIEDSYKITSPKKMKEILKEVEERTKEETLKRRSLKSMLKQWKYQNRLYKMHINRKQNKKCIFQPIKKSKEIYYSIFSFSFVKIRDIKKYLKIKIKEIQFRLSLKKHKQLLLKAYDEIIECKFLYQYYNNEQFSQLKERLTVHDDSKLTELEFQYYRKQYYPINIGEQQQNYPNFLKAQQHHYNVNAHHWQHRKNKTHFSVDNENETLDVLENLCDWLAVGYLYGNRPFEYYEQIKNEIILHPEEKKFLEDLIYQGIDKQYIKESK